MTADPREELLRRLTLGECSMDDPEVRERMAADERFREEVLSWNQLRGLLDRAVDEQEDALRAVDDEPPAPGEDRIADLVRRERPAPADAASPRFRIVPWAAAAMAVAAAVLLLVRLMGGGAEEPVDPSGAETTGALGTGEEIKSSPGWVNGQLTSLEWSGKMTAGARWEVELLDEALGPIPGLPPHRTESTTWILDDAERKAAQAARFGVVRRIRGGRSEGSEHTFELLPPPSSSQSEVP